jgi:zinc protease
MNRPAIAASLVLVALQAPLAAQQLDRTRPPVLPPPAPLRVPPVQTARLANGLEIHVVEMREVPVVAVNMMIRAGSVRDPRDLPGLATFTAGMLDEGAGNRSAPEIAEEAAFLGTSINTGATHEYASVDLSVPKRQLAAALDLMADVVLRPAFPEEEIARQRELRRTAILQLRDNPTAQAPIAFNSIVFGSAHPYGWPTGGNDESAALLDRERVAAFYRTWYRPNNSRILFVGDISLAEARRMVTERYDRWERGPVQPPPVFDPPAPAPRSFYLVDKPGAAQSVIRMGHAGVARSSPDYFALQVMNTILGGSFTSRLNMNLREARGYTYGASSGFSFRRLAGPFSAQASVVTAMTDSSLIEFFMELRRIRDSVVPDEELNKAKQYIVLGLPGDFETTSGTSQQILDLLINDLPLDYYRTYTARINAVTAADVQRVARRYINPDNFAVVVVGDRSRIESGIRALNEGPLQLRDLWGREVR